MKAWKEVVGCGGCNKQQQLCLRSEEDLKWKASDRTLRSHRLSWRRFFECKRDNLLDHIIIMIIMTIIIMHFAAFWSSSFNGLQSRTCTRGDGSLWPLSRGNKQTCWWYELAAHILERLAASLCTVNTKSPPNSEREGGNSRWRFAVVCRRTRHF